MLLPVGISFNEHPERMVSVESVVNMQPELSMGGRAPVVLRSCPGFAEFSDGNVAGTEGRGAVYVAGVVYAVLGKYLYSVDSAGTAVKIGRIDGSGVVGIDATNEQVCIATGVTTYIYDISTDVLSAPGTAPAGFTVTAINSRFVIEDPSATGASAGRFYWSGVLDGATWTGLDFATAEQKPDATVRVDSIGNTLVVFGSGTIEFWRGNASGFVPITGATQQVGIAGAHSAAQADNTICFLASDGSVRTLQGYQAVPVSTPAVESELSADSTVNGFAYREEGHSVFQFSKSDKTLCYDSAQSAAIGKPVWFEKSYSGSRDRASAYVYAFGRHLVMSFEDGKIYEYSRSYYPDARQFTLPTVADDANRAWSILDSVELICRTGSGDIPDDNPQVMMTVSRDHGYTYGQERWSGLGTIGKYLTRCTWRRFGRFRQLNMRFRITDQVDFTVIGVNARGR